MTRNAEHKARLYELVRDLHSLRLSDPVIARLVGRSRAHVTRIRASLGLKARWFDPEDAFASLPKDMRERVEQFEHPAK